MSKNTLIVVSVLEYKKPIKEVCQEFDVSRSWVYELIRRYRLLGPNGMDPRSKKPLGNSLAIPSEVHAEIAALRAELIAEGLDAGAQSIQFRLIENYGHAPSLSTIWRSLRNQGLVEYTPKKKPKLYLQRFEAFYPNETWQSDVTHIRLRNGKVVDVLNFLDDHSRLLIRSTVHPTVTAAIVVEQFLEAISEFDSPQSTLTDNGLVFTTSRTRGGQNAFEYLLEELGIEQKNSRAHHPQTQGKIERFHQTLKKWLSARPRAANITELQALIDQFRELYNNSRPHKALKGKTPAVAYQARPKAKPESDPIPGNKKRRNDRVDKEGKVSLRRAGRMHHIGVGRAHTGKRVHLVFTSKKVMVVDQRTAEILGENLIEPTRSYWPKIQTPGHESL
jgi:transposase InsO family protein